LHRQTETYEAGGSNSTLEQKPASVTGGRVPNSPFFINTCSLAATAKKLNKFTMKKSFFLSLFIIATNLSFAQNKTHAFFMIGNYSYPEWEKLEFEFTDEGRIIRYSYRKNERGHKLLVLGTKYIGNQKALMVKIPKFNKIYLVLRDKKNSRVLMTSEDNTYRKYFPLGYEGSVDGRGTYCDICANEPDEAFDIVDTFF
jgi:hypothetical protein